MRRVQNPNLEIIELAVTRLGALAEEMVFVGGCATGLLITDVAAPPIRVTRDVDTIVQVATLAEYLQLSDRLRQLGFREDTSEGAPLCRWITQGVILDVMPTDGSILGFSNRWYAQAVEHAVRMALPSGKSIRMVSAPYFLISKLEAFDGRGQGDYLMSHDIEDVVAVLDGRSELIDEVAAVDPRLVQVLAERFDGLLQARRFVESIPGHMPNDPISQGRVPLVVNRIKSLVKMPSLIGQ
ncbi:hypothetical protein [Sedimenticola sp.]|uniref:hypothetical protein n=1 Tax=Sedimenticola sp. TaxID=1940285 RepID=UPI003D0D1140